MCELLLRTHKWVPTTNEWTAEKWIGGDTIEATYTRTLILQCRHCSARKKIVTKVTY